MTTQRHQQYILYLKVDVQREPQCQITGYKTLTLAKIVDYKWLQDSLKKMFTRYYKL